MAESYDARNSGLAPISDNMHFLTGLVLEDLPEGARVLCVGVGTGAEILALAQAHPGWHFTGVDPSAEMLEVCRARLERAGLTERCTLLHGYVGDVPEEGGFDAVLSILVAHFIPRAERPGFYRAVLDRLRPGGRFVSAEICADLDGPDVPELLKAWERVQIRMGATPASLAALPETLRTALSVLSPEETQALHRAAGFEGSTLFFQAILIRAYVAMRPLS